MSRIPIRLPGPKSKYHAKREGKYASKKEAKHAGELALMEKVGAIRDLKEQVRFQLIPKDELGRAIVYVADFTFYELAVRGGIILPPSAGMWDFVVLDVKGVRTPVYKLKKRLMWRVHGIKVRENGD